MKVIIEVQDVRLVLKCDVDIFKELRRFNHGWSYGRLIILGVVIWFTSGDAAFLATNRYLMLFVSTSAHSKSYIAIIVKLLGFMRAT